MEQYVNNFASLLKFIFKIMPVVKEQAKIARSVGKLCMPDLNMASRISATGGGLGIEVQKSEHAEPETYDPEMLCCCLFALFPGVDSKNVISFITTIYALRNLLEDFRAKNNTTDDAEIMNIFSCLSCAVDTARSSICPFNRTANSGLGNGQYQTSDTVREFPVQGGISDIPHSQFCLSNRCRIMLATLPSYNLVADKIKKYMQLYVVQQAFRHYPFCISKKILNSWSSGYISDYPEISGWEFCMSADSLLGIGAMYAAATRPGITAEEVSLLDEACFPWLNGLSSILKSMLRLRTSISDGGLNFTCFYRNLKECEERTLYFAAKAEASCMKLKEGKCYAEFIKTMVCIYLSDPEADFGMMKIASSNILDKYSLQTYCKAVKLARYLCLLSSKHHSADPG